MQTAGRNEFVFRVDEVSRKQRDQRTICTPVFVCGIKAMGQTISSIADLNAAPTLL